MIAFVEAIEREISKGTKHTKLSLEKLGASFGITDKNEVKELTELAIVRQARKLAWASGNSRERYQSIVDLYGRQVTLSHRTSQSMLLQQYSTPAPIGYLMGLFCELDKLSERDGFAFEPSAGNGLLTIAGKPRRIYVNEIDDIRNRNLQTQGFADVWQKDASSSFPGLAKRFLAVITNPPFGVLDDPVSFDTFRMRTLDHIMAIRALETMRDDGKAAIIIGGHTTWDKKGRIQEGKNRIFFNYLYSRYYVKDVININGRNLYSRQGTAFNVRLILIDGRKPLPEGAAPVFDKNHDTIVHSFDGLFERVTDAMSKRTNHTKIDLSDLEREAAALAAELGLDELGAPYQPASNACVVLNTQVPDSMAYETAEALKLITREVGGDIDNFVRDRLRYKTKKALCEALSAEQIDAVAMAIYNIEARGQGMIIGDQTGIGKGRVAAAVIRYATNRALTPVFLTEKVNLFSDIYRDLKAIGSGNLRPFIVNSRESKTDIKDEDGNVIYQAPPLPIQQENLVANHLPAEYDFVLATYTQFNSEEKKPVKPNFLRRIAEGNILILDEAHNSSGSSNTGEFMQGVVARAKGVAFLSATFAKRPDNMPIYAMKTAIADCNMSRDQLVESIQRGGVALQEVISSQLVAEGQMLRRERSFEGVEVNYITLDEKAQEHQAIADNITALLRDIIDFQKNHVNNMVEELDDIAVKEGKAVGLREGTSQAGVDNMPYFSKIFQVINQMLFSLKAEAVAERAIMRLKEGKKPVIAFASTMGSFIETLESRTGLPVGDGDTIDADFSEVLKRGLDGVMRYTEYDVDGKPIHKYFEVSELSVQGQAEYARIREVINTITTGITISPIDVVIKKIKAAGYTVAEVTGRKFELQLAPKGTQALVLARRRINTNDAFRQFNNNEVDVLMINQSGSTGASAHAIPTAKVPASEVKQRVMIVLQAELDISTEVQKRGRINRTGQILKPIYDYVTSAIPAENRLMMMLQNKLKSLDANTASNQKQSNKILDVPDFLNKYGDKIVTEYLGENPEVNKILDDPLRLEGNEDGESSGETIREEAAHKVSGRVAVLSVKMQQDFYAEVAERYQEYVEYLKQIGEYDLELEAMNLAAETISSKVVNMGVSAGSVFGEDSILETVKANVLKKPFTKTELENLLNEVLKGQDPIAMQDEILATYTAEAKRRYSEEEQEAKDKYDEQVLNIPDEKGVSNLSRGSDEWHKKVDERKKELEEALQLKINHLQKKHGNRHQYLQRIFKAFFTGRALNYTFKGFGAEPQLVPAAFIGFQIDSKKKNPYAPSAIKLRFAIANSSKYIAIPASYSEEIMAILGASSDQKEISLEALLTQWEEHTKQSNTDRTTRHIVTGNLLQASATYRGKLVNYTKLDGTVQKGILMPEYWDPGEQVGDKVTVPILKALPLIQSLVTGQNMTTSTGIGFIKQSNGRLKVIVSASRSKAGDVFLDKQLLALVDGNNFQKVSDKMVAYLDESNLRDFVTIVQQSHSCSVDIQSHQLKYILKTSALTNRKAIELPGQESDEADDELALLELEAEALILELELLEFEPLKAA